MVGISTKLVGGGRFKKDKRRGNIMFVPFVAQLGSQYEKTKTMAYLGGIENYKRYVILKFEN